jgi:hypothetical protein
MELRLGSASTRYSRLAENLMKATRSLRDSHTVIEIIENKTELRNHHENKSKHCV